MDNNSLTLSSLRLEHCSSLLTVAWVRGTLPVTPPWRQEGVSWAKYYRLHITDYRGAPSLSHLPGDSRESAGPNITDLLNLVVEGDVQGGQGWQAVSAENGVEEGVSEEAAEIPLQVQNLQLLGRDKDGPEVKEKIYYLRSNAERKMFGALLTAAEKPCTWKLHFFFETLPVCPKTKEQKKYSSLKPLIRAQGILV